MARPSKIRNSGNYVQITTPSHYGSHASMVIHDFEDGVVACQDDSGKYLTKKILLDNGLADSNRYARNVEQETEFVEKQLENVDE